MKGRASILREPVNNTSTLTGTEPRPIRILVADDHLIARVGLVTIINEQADMEVVAEASNGQQAVSLYRMFRPDIVLMDERMPVMSGCDAADRIRSEFPHARIMTLSTYSVEEDVRRAVRAGVDGYLKKDVEHDELIRAIRAVHSGQRHFRGQIGVYLENASHSELSSREVEVLTLVAKGFSNKRIAYSLSIADNTVANHLKNILAKMGVDDRTQAATMAIQRGIIRFQD
jgi:two-component system, NarL family, response regulator